jgi:hypothetical protein
MHTHVSQIKQHTNTNTWCKGREISLLWKQTGNQFFNLKILWAASNTIIQGWRKIRVPGEEPPTTRPDCVPEHGMEPMTHRSHWHW